MRFISNFRVNINFNKKITFLLFPFNLVEKEKSFKTQKRQN